MAFAEKCPPPVRAKNPLLRKRRFAALIAGSASCEVYNAADRNLFQLETMRVAPVSNELVTICRAFVALLGAFASTGFAQDVRGGSRVESALIDPTQSSVYVKFRRLAKGVPLLEGETDQRIWLSLRNNTRFTIRVRAFGLPDDYAEAEAGLMYEVEPASGIILEGPVPGGYWFEVGSSIDVGPGEELPFSVPRDHLGPGLAIRIDFSFNWEQNSRYTRHSSVFAYWDLPDNLRDREKEKKLKRSFTLGGSPSGAAEYYRSPLPTVLRSPAPPTHHPKR